MKERDHLIYLGVGGSITLRWIFKIYVNGYHWRALLDMTVLVAKFYLLIVHQNVYLITDCCNQVSWTSEVNEISSNDFRVLTILFATMSNKFYQYK